MLKEFNEGYNEINSVPTNEHNEVRFENSISKSETNVFGESISKNKTRKKPQLNVLTHFIFLCASIVILQVGIYIPMFSEIFAPSTQTVPAIIVSKTYITNVTINPPFDDYDVHFNKWYKILDIYFDVGTDLSNYKMLVFELSFVGNEKDIMYSRLTKAIVESKAGFPRYIIEKDGKTYGCNLKVYCTTDNPEEIEFEEKKYIPGEEDLCYLIYKHEEIINY